MTDKILLIKKIKNSTIWKNYEKIPYEDSKSIKLIQDCQTVGLFLLENNKINQIIKYFKIK